MAELSPMMKQYFDIKEKHKDSILFFRLGDFYEMFFEDAKTASKELELTLTGKDCGSEERAPMCGIPYHSSESYIARLVSKGYKVAICEQMENPAEAKGLVKRDVIRIITPGTVIESSMLNESQNNFICSIFINSLGVGMCFCDISTGELCAIKFNKEIDNNIKNELARFRPSEVLIGGEINKFKEISIFIKEKLYSSIEILEDSAFELENCTNILLEHFKKESLEDLGLKDKNQLVSSLGGLIGYLRNTQKKGIERVTGIELYTEAQFMGLDLNTRRNLELLETMRNKEKRGSLLWVLDNTKTAMGKRLIRTWIEKPLLNCTQILLRQNAVEELFLDTILRGSIIDDFSGIYDIERLMTKVVYGSANCCDLKSLSYTISKIPKLKMDLSVCKSKLLVGIYEDIEVLDDIMNLIEASINDDPPVSVHEGGIIKRGYNKEIDLLNGDMTHGKQYIAEIEAREREKTGISKLKIGYNRVFGYYIEVSNSFKDKVPETYIRKQTLTNCERYITQELKELEGRILGARDKAIEMEYQLFVKIRETVAAELLRVQKTAKAIAKLDVLCSFAQVAAKNNYCKSNINLNGKIILKESRHPVVEKLLNNSAFVSNDVNLDMDKNEVAIITGPNMAGKSTYMRQVALIVLMSQLGSFVPAKFAEIGIVDNIFTRVGASDDLASGQSTFMVEMNEVANILKNATSNSLLVLDEIGRGTSTFDGMSIARAVLEYVANKKYLGAKTLFATHYHELTELENTLEGVKNYNIAVKKRGDDITFLRRIIPGGADDSYGIEVAKLAGIPESIIKRAKEILKSIEKEDTTTANNTKKTQEKSLEDCMQMSMVPSKSSKIQEKLENLDVDTLTPIESMNILFELVKMTKD